MKNRLSIDSGVGWWDEGGSDCRFSLGARHAFQIESLAAQDTKIT